MTKILDELQENTLRLIDEFEKASKNLRMIYEHNIILAEIIKKHIKHKSVTELINEHKRDTGSSTGRRS